MRQPPWFRVLRSLGLEFWLLLPILGLVSWASSGLIMNWRLSRADQIEKPLVLDTGKQSIVAVSSIEAVIDQKQGIARVKIRSIRSTLRALEFAFPTTNASEIEIAISRELGLPLEKVRTIIRYRRNAD